MKTTLATMCAAACAVLLTGCPAFINPIALVQGAPSYRVVHLSPDAPAVQVCVDGHPGVVRLPFGNTSFYRPFPPANDFTYDLNVLPFPSDCADDGVIEATLQVQPRTDTTIVAFDTLENIRPLVLRDDNSPVTSGFARVRFVHASPDAGSVDIATAAGATLYNDVPFGAIADYTELATGDYVLQVRDPGGTQVLLELPTITLEAGRVYSIFATGFAEDLGVLILVDNTGEVLRFPAPAE